ncbi:hypothetical protein IMZ48_12955 [Candidatus Bathyarchaeota archaeon]|nr:hypothetical protein [Candidatus Bathyarchaeota archaeon]
MTRHPYALYIVGDRNTVWEGATADEMKGTVEQDDDGGNVSSSGNTFGGMLDNFHPRLWKGQARRRIRGADHRARGPHRPGRNEQVRQLHAPGRGALRVGCSPTSGTKANRHEMAHNFDPAIDPAILAQQPASAGFDPQ